MFNKALIERIKHSVVLMTLGIVISVVPFYFQTKAMTEDNKETLSEHTESINLQQDQVNELMVKSEVGNTEIENIKRSLERIEKKIDRLIERDE